MQSRLFLLSGNFGFSLQNVTLSEDLVAPWRIERLFFNLRSKPIKPACFI